MKHYPLFALSLTAGLFVSCDPASTSLGSAIPIKAPTIVATPTATLIEGEANMVISPYKPYNKIDITGYKSGNTVGDISTAAVDAKGKAIMSSVKPFLIP